MFASRPQAHIGLRQTICKCKDSCNFWPVQIYVQSRFAENLRKIIIEYFFGLTILSTFAFGIELTETGDMWRNSSWIVCSGMTVPMYGKEKKKQIDAVKNHQHLVKIPNSVSSTFHQLPQKYTISTLHFTNYADNQSICPNKKNV